MDEEFSPEFGEAWKAYMATRESVSPPPEVSPEITDEMPEDAYLAALEAYEADYRGVGGRIGAVARTAFAAGVAAGRTRAAERLGLLRGSEAWLIAVGLPEGQENN